MKKLTIFAIAWITSCMLFAQNCGFVPTQKSLEYTKKMASNMIAYDASNVLPISIPVVVNLVRNSSGSVGVSVDTFMEEFEKANEKFLGSGLQFFVCQEINIINSDEFYLMSPSEQSTIALQNDIDDVVNIYVAQTLTTNGGGSLCGFAYTPGGPERLYITNSCLLNGSTLPHELGHFFGLQHTHGQSNAVNSTNELADGSNGLTTGDFVVDTPSDPNVNGLVTTSCEYTGNYLDNNGQLHRPDVNNIMSYSKKYCREYFTQGQMDLMYSVALDGRDNLQCSDFRISFTSSNPIECNLPLTVDFEDCSVGSVLTEWDIYNDGTIDYTGENVSHTFTETGTYDIAMRITNSDGDVISKVYEGYVVAGGVDVNTQVVTLELKLDRWPSETSWKLVNSADEVVYEGGGYQEGVDDEVVYTYDFNVYPDGCYDFIIEDAYGDGICCTTGGGYYKLIDDSGNVFAEGGDFSVIDYSYFNVVDNTLSAGGVSLDKFTVTPNPFNNQINLSSQVEYILFDLTGKIILSGNSNKIETSSLSKGIYLLRIGQNSYKLIK